MNLDGIISGVLNSGPGKAVAAALGFPEATPLRRGEAMPANPLVVSAVGGASTLVADALRTLDLDAEAAVVDVPEARSTDENGRERPPAYPGRIGAIVVDATAAARVDDLEQVRAVLRPAVRAVEPSGRVIIVAGDPATASDVEGAAVRQALDGIMRSVGKELRGGATSNLVQVADGSTADELAQVLRFLLSGRSAYVDGQPLVLADGATGPRPEPRIVVVTGAARGIGAAIARRFAADGATVVALDVPIAGEALAGVANEIRGTALQLDITVPDAGDRIAQHVVERYGPDARIGAIVHCAGILRDKMLANLDEKRWGAVLQVNLAAQLRINDVLLRPGRPGGLADGSRIIGVASTSGWAGNKGQTNYAASKAGVMGMVRALSAQLADRGIVVNGVAPGFIETDMTASIPVIDREIFRRSSSLLQGGRPADVAETIVFLADPGTPLNGQVLRVCGQLIVGR
ncbi:3-oxoacyl-ACP reductase [Micropruina sonneratiae]|uniref:3-oxoacyl-ACP reductase n=1 Tax=Micropruina sonneratiae TaxID=2986940 RepID=UPI0022269620|nr:3-oxoacyl-ACP reductase [Micropruina sp. KQZ13P-5]MCW3159513.1 3-oxoacyl-ACP reductase [Micropruina sp. KQZ13P-5]